MWREVLRLLKQFLLHSLFHFQAMGDLLVNINFPVVIDAMSALADGTSIDVVTAVLFYCLGALLHKIYSLSTTNMVQFTY